MYLRKREHQSGEGWREMEKQAPCLNRESDVRLDPWNHDLS